MIEIYNRKHPKISAAMEIYQNAVLRKDSNSFAHFCLVKIDPCHTSVMEFHQLAEKSHTVVDHFYIALFSTLEQTQCALVICDSKQAAVAFYGVF